MKIKVEIDATAQEVREFFGLPDLRPIQERLLKEIENSSTEGVPGFDPLTLLRPLFPAQMQSLEGLQKAFWETFNQAPANPRADDSTTADSSTADAKGTSRKTSRTKKTHS